MPDSYIQKNLSDASEKRRILEQYAGIFPDNIEMFGQTISKKINKPKKNFSR